MNLEILIKQACEVVAATGQYVKQQSARLPAIEIVEKDLNNLVSEVDKTAEMQLVDQLQRLTPDCGFITEENTVKREHKTIEWIIDPLDGTTNFLYGIPAYCISVGLRIEGQLAAGVVYELGREEMFYAFRDGGAFLNGSPIVVSQRSELSHSLLATGFPFFDFSGIDDYISTLKYLMRNTRGLRRIGSAALDLAYVACGRFDGFFEYSLSPWDVAGGAVLITEAGGRVTDFSGGNNFLFGREIIATNGRIHDALKQVLEKHFRN